MNNEYRWKLKCQVMKKEFVIIYCKYVYIKSTFNVINIVLFVSEKKEKNERTLPEELSSAVYKQCPP
jgi:hypothetical protein